MCTQLAELDVTTRCDTCEEHNAKGKSFCKCASMLPELEAEKKIVKETTKQVMICLSGLQW